ncbi:hypothetical protein SUGI_0129630 [Cryptomeria japonica]|nr:hypothetical protein SUGI_0129630 [Cryptomeria japonica]
MELEKGEPDTLQGFVNWKGEAARKDKHGGFRAAMFTFVMMGFQNMAFVSLACNLTSYLMMSMCFDISKSATTVTNFMGTANLLCLVGAFISDTYFTRLRTLIISAVIASMGYIILAIQAYFPSLSPACRLKEKLDGREATLLFVGLYLIAIGTGGLLPAGSTLGADQFDENDPTERKQKHLVWYDVHYYGYENLPLQGAWGQSPPPYCTG